MSAAPAAPTKYVLRAYQDAIYTSIVGDLSAGVRDLLLHAPPASGKTLMTWAIVAKAMRDGLFDLVLVVSPTGQIRDQWTKEGVQVDACGELLTYDAEQVQPGAVRDVAFWRGSGVYTACHAGALSSKVGEMLRCERPDLRTCLVVVDEAHHASTVNVSGETIDVLLELGATVLRSTGTPWHRKGRVKLDTAHGDQVTTRTFGLSNGALARQRDERGRPYAPQNWVALQVQVPFRTDDATLAVDDGRERAKVEPTEYRDKSLAEMVRQWVKAGCPKAVFNLPRVEWAKGTKRHPEHGLVARLARSRSARKVLGHAVRVCDLSGEQTGAERLALDTDREAKRWRDSQIDVVISCHRANEGMDWKWCSDVYNVGVPGSLVLLIQRWCRASRSKVGLVGYPRTAIDAGTGRRVAQNDVQRMTFFVPILTEDAQDRLWNLHHDHALLAACMLECYEVGLQWAASVDRPEEFGQGLVGRAEDTRTAARMRAALEIQVTEAEDCGDLERVVAMEAILARMPADGTRITGTEFGAIIEELSKGRTVDEAAALISASEVVLAATSGDGLASTARARARRAREAAVMAAQGKMPGFIRSAIRASKVAAFREFVATHGADLVASIPAGVRRNAVVFTGYDTERLGDALRALTPPPWYGMNLVQMQAFARAVAARWSARNGGQPSKHVGACEELGGYTWGGLDMALRRHGSTLADTLGRQCNTFEQNAVAIETFHEATGLWPCQTATDSIERKLAMALNQLRQSAPDLCVKYDIPLTSGRESRSRENAIAIKAFHEATGQWPVKSATNSDERRLAVALSTLRQSLPDLCEEYGIPLRADLSEASRRARGKHQFPALAEFVVSCVVHGTPVRRKTIGTVTCTALDRLLHFTVTRPGASRGLASTFDRCQVNSLARLMAEVRADCWRFTLDGESSPDTRPWSDLLALGDHARIVAAERTHYLDWQDTRLRGGTRWTDNRPGGGSKIPDAVRRPWTPPASAT